MQHETLGNLTLWDLPDLLDAHFVGLGIHRILLEVKHFFQLFSQVPARTFPEDRDLGLQAIPRLKIGSLGTIGVDPLVRGLDTHNPLGAGRSFLPEHLDARKPGQKHDIHSRNLTFPDFGGHPSDHLR